MSEPAPAEAVVRQPGWGFGDVAIGLVLTLALATVAVVVAQTLVPDTPTAKAWASVALVVVPWLGLAGWPIVAARRKGNGPVADYRLAVGPRQVGVGILGGIAALGLALAAAAVVQALIGRPFDSAIGQVATETTSASRAALVALALTAVVGAPFAEELMFRGLLYGSLEKFGQPAPWCVAWSTVGFALFHFEPVRLPVLLVIGAVLGLVRWRTGSTGAAVVAHMTVNLPAAVALAAL